MTTCLAVGRIEDDYGAAVPETPDDGQRERVLPGAPLLQSTSSIKAEPG